MPTPKKKKGHDSDTSTLSRSSHDSDKDYPVEAILAEGPVRDGEFPGPHYLIKWEGYKLWECTWEPRVKLLEIMDMLNDWEKEKEQSDFDEKQDLNIIAWERAKREREQRKARHTAKKRKREQRRLVVKAASLSESDSDDDVPLLPRRKSVQTVQRVVESSDSEEDVPLAQIRRQAAAQKAAEEHTTARPNRTASSRDPGLVAQSKAKNPLFVNAAPKPRPGPFEESPSPFSGSEDSLFKEAQKGTRKSTSNTQSQTQRSGARQQSSDRQGSVNISGASINSTDVLKTSRDNNNAKVAPPTPISGPSVGRPKVVPGPKASASRKMSSGDTALHAQERGPDTMNKAISRTAPSKPAVSKMKKTSSTSTGGPIKMVNRRVEPTRSEWNTTDKKFKTLKSLNSANKRDRRDRTPDPDSLQFVNAPPGFAPSTQARKATETNAYSRRDVGRSRVQEQSDDETRRDPKVLFAWEQDKVPLICWEYRNNSCRYSTGQCRFLHREGGYPLGPLDGVVPGKYRKPAVACWHYMENPVGCHHKPEDCDYAHYNTGLVASEPGTRGAATKIDPARRPKKDEVLLQKAAAGIPITGKTMKTCWYYMEDPKGCHRTSVECKFAHYNTGLLAAKTGQGSMQIDPSRRPRSDASLSGEDVPQTCYYYMDDPNGCRRSADECHFAHYNTGLMASRAGYQPTIIDRARQPRSETLTQHAVPQPPMKPGFDPCFFWYMGYGCSKGDSCRRPHYQTGSVPRPPPGWRAPPGEDLRHALFAPPTSLTATGANATVVRRAASTEATAAFDGVAPKDIHPTLDTSTIEDTLMVDDVPISVDKPEVAPMLPSPPPPPPPPLMVTASPPPPPPPTTVLEATIADQHSAVGASNASAVEALSPYSCVEMKTMIEDVCKLDFAKMFTFNDEDRGLMDRRAFLIFHPDDHMEELELITRWLLMCHVEVFTLWMPGSWDSFKSKIVEGGSGVVLIHSLVLAPLKELPGLGDLLRHDIRIWSVGHQDPEGYVPLISDPATPQEYCCVEMFPHGGVIVLADDVFDNPVEARDIIKLFIDKVNECQKRDMPLEDDRSVLKRWVPWRLAVRPGILQWLEEWCLAHENACQAEEVNAKAMMDIYFDLKDTGLCLPLDSPVYNHPEGYYPVMSERTDVALEYSGQLKDKDKDLNDQNSGNEWLVNYYAEWMLVQARNYRHLVVVHPRPTSVEWKKDIPVIEEVIAPGKCVEYLEQSGEGSRFDCWEWLHPLLDELPDD